MKVKTAIRYALISIAAIALIACVVVLFVARSVSFRDYLRRKIVQSAEEQTGARVEIAGMALRWRPLTADLYGIVAHGTEQNEKQPLFQAEHLSVSVGIRALLKKKIDVGAIVLDRPVVNLRVDNEGRSNLPIPPPTAKPGSSNGFSVALHHATLNDGVLSYNNRQIPLSADVWDLRARVALDIVTGKYNGAISYDHAAIDAPGLRPFEHRATCEFVTGRQELFVKSLLLTTGPTQLDAQLHVTQYQSPVIDGSYHGAVSTADLARILKDPSLPLGRVDLAGAIAYRSAPSRSFLESVDVTGNLSSSALDASVERAAVTVKKIRAEYSLRDGNLTVSKFDGDLLSGHVAGNFQMLHLSGNSSSRLIANATGISLSEATATLPAARRENIRLLGKLNFVAQTSWSSGMRELKSHLRAEMKSVAQQPSAPSDGIPVNGAIDMTYDGARQSASFTDSHLRTGSTQLDLSGVLSRNSNLRVAANAGDLQELQRLISAISPPDSNSTVSSEKSDVSPKYDVRGSAQFSGQITGSTGDPRITGRISAANLQVQQSKWSTMHADIDVTSHRATFQDGLLQSASQGQIDFSGNVALANWSPTSTTPLSLRVQASKLSVADLQRLAGLNYPVTGDLSADIALAGSVSSPSGHGTLHVVKATAWNEPLQSVAADFHGARNSIQSKAHLQIAAGQVDAELTYTPQGQHYTASVNTSALRLDRIQSVQQRARGIAGVLTANLKGDGTLSDPQMTAHLQVPQLQMAGQTFSQLQAQLDVAHSHAKLEMSSQVIQGYLQAKGGVDLIGDYPATLAIDLRALPIGPLLAAYFPSLPTELHGQTEIHGTLRGPLKDPSKIDARIEIPSLNLEYKSLQLANDGPLRAAYRAGIATVEQAKMKGSGTNLSVQGTVPVRSTQPWDLTATGGVDVALLQMISPGTNASGRVDLNLHARGNISKPDVQGQIRIVDAALFSDSLPFAFESVNGQLSLSGNKLEISQLKGVAGGGSIDAHGFLIYGAQPSFNFDLQAKGVRIRPTGIRSVLDAQLQLNGTTQSSQLSGQVLVDRLSFQQGFDLASLSDQFSGGPGAPTNSPFENKMKINVSVQSSQNLNLASSQVSMEGSANLNVTGTAANPVILGRIALTRGEVFFLGKRFEIQNGTIVFANPARTQPVLNVFVNTTVEQYNITINFAGPVDRLKMNYTSDPALSQADIINLLAFGQTGAEKASNAAAPASVGAENVLAQGATGQLAKGVQSLAGISQLTIDPLAGNNQNPGSQLAIQQRISGSLLLTFSTDVTSTQSQSVQLQYQPKRNVTISILRDQYGGYGFDVKFHKVF